MKVRIKSITLTVLGLSGTIFSQFTSAEEITGWVIDPEIERPYFLQLEEKFNNAYKDQDLQVKLIPIPGYNSAIQVAALSNGLPDVIFVDGPNMASYVWSGMLQPLDEWITKDITDDMLKSVIEQGTYAPDGKVYMVSPYDSSVVLWGNKKYLDEAGIAIPKNLDEAWTMDEFEQVLDKLSKVKGVEWPLDLKLNYEGEWLTYGFAPYIQNRGADLINRQIWKAEGMVNSQGAIDGLTQLQNWANKGWIVPASAGDNRFYGDKTAALSWVGNWMWPPHKQGLGEDLVVIPAPKFEGKVFSPNGGWGWSMPATTTKQKAVGVFINYAMSPEQVATYADITGYIPARNSAIQFSTIYSDTNNQQAAIFVEQAQKSAMVRPVHPAYPVITASFGQAVRNIMQGADVKTELDSVARKIDEDIEDNASYPPFDAK